VRPKEVTAAEALGQAECRDVSSGAEPLVVDWKPEQRGDLEVAMKDGVAIVRYGCDGIELLAECKLDGDYGFIGMTRKEQVVKLASSDELRANLPLTGASLSSSLDRGSTLDVAMIMVGKKRTTWSGPSLADLKGECQGATHYVRGATVGAFALASGTRADVRAAAQVFAAGAEGASTSSKELRNRDGDPSECQKASPDADAPPAQCGAPIRLVLAPLAKAAATDEAAVQGAAQREAAACPAGLVESGGKCTTPESATAFQCRPGDRNECRAQCERGHAGSCRALAELLASSTDAANAVAPAQRACEAGEARACSVLGELMRAGSGVPKDEAAAQTRFEQGCTGGDAAGCTSLGKAVMASDAARALALFVKACEGGDAAGCAAAGAAHLGSAKRDVAAARPLLTKACDGGQAPSCSELGNLYAAGEPGFPKQPILAEIVLRRGCVRASSEACAGLGKVLMSKPQADSGEAKRHFERACLGRELLACAALKVMFADPRPVAADVKQRTALSGACTSGSARACADLGLLDAASGNAALAKPSLQRACAMGDAWGCAIVAKLGK
jgi:hypothetical protein